MDISGQMLIFATVVERGSISAEALILNLDGTPRGKLRIASFDGARRGTAVGRPTERGVVTR